MMNHPSMADQMSGPVEIPAAANGFKIKRIGGRPLAFSGSELGMAMSFTPGIGHWYEINIYRTDQQAFVVAVRTFFESEDETDFVRAWECESFDQVMDSLEGYDPAQDIKVTCFADDPSLSLPDLAAEAFTLRARAEAARQQFRGLVGEILHDLETA